MFIMDFVIVGLGNPGAEYETTRHNIGFWIVDVLAGKYGGRWSHGDDRFISTRAKIAGYDGVLVKPRTYMNRAGAAVAPFMADGKVKTARLLITLDDFALPLGHIRLRPRGSDGGHNGLKSIASALGHASYPRLRLGVGPVPAGEDPADFVLGEMVAEIERDALKMVQHASKCVSTWVEHGINVAMNRFNSRIEEPPTDESG